MCHGGPLWERAQTLGRGSPPVQHARNKRTGVCTAVSSPQTEKGIWGNKRQKGRGEGTHKKGTFFWGQLQEGSALVQRRRGNVERMSEAWKFDFAVFIFHQCIRIWK